MSPMTKTELIELIVEMCRLSYDAALGQEIDSFSMVAMDLREVLRDQLEKREIVD